MRTYLFSALIFVSVCLSSQGHDPNLNAIAEFNERLKNNPDDLEALKARGSTYRALEFFDSALIDLIRALELEPDNPEITSEIGMCHYHLGEVELTTKFLDKGAQLLEEAVNSGGVANEDAVLIERELFDYRMRNYIDLKQFENALIEGEKLKTILEGKLSYICDMADIYIALGRHEEALKLYMQAVKDNCSFERYCVGAANCLLNLNRQEEALKIMEEWKEDDPDSVMPWFHESIIKKDHLNDLIGAKAAMDHGEKMVRARIDKEEYPDIEDMVHLARILQVSSRWSESFEIMQELLEDYRGHWLVVYLQGQNVRALGKEREALSFEKEAKIYKRLNPMDWLQAYNIIPPMIIETPHTTQGDWAKDDSDDSKITGVYLTGGGAVLLLLVFLIYIMMKKK